MQRKRKLCNKSDTLSQENKKLKSLAETNLDTLYTQGYQVLKNRIEISPRIKKYLIELAKKNSAIIFNHNEKSRQNDKKRRQVNIRPRTQYMIEFMDGLNQKLSSMFPHLKINDWVVIESKPGCKPQAAHTDYPPSDKNPPTNNNQIPINVLVCLQSNTYLNVWPRSHELIQSEAQRQEYLNVNKDIGEIDNIKPIKMETIEMAMSDVLLFRGDLVHGGAGYDESNCRMHCFMDHGYRIPNRTWLIDGNGSEFLKKMIAVDHP